MKTSFVASILAAASTALAAPATLVPKATGQLSPSSTAQFEVSTGARTASALGLVFKDGRSSDITTLSTFNFDSSFQGKTCEFGFKTDEFGIANDSKLFDLFSSLAPAGPDTTTWPDGNLRDQQRGRFFVPGPAQEAQFQEGFGAARSFPCPVDQKLGVEQVGVFDADRIEWNTATGGLFVRYY